MHSMPPCAICKDNAADYTHNKVGIKYTLNMTM